MRERNVKPEPPGRPREFDEVEVIEKLMSVFWERGYEATGLSDIMAATGLNKGSLYAAFGNKRAMYLRALQRYEAIAVDGVCADLRATGDPAERLRSFLTIAIDARWTQRDTRGCFLCNASVDQASSDDEVRSLVQRGYRKMGRAIVDVLKEVRPASTDARLQGDAELCLTTYSGLRIMARASVPRRQLEQAREACLAAVLEC